MFNQKNFKVKRHCSLHNFKTWLMFTAQKKKLSSEYSERLFQILKYINTLFRDLSETDNQSCFFFTLT